MSEPGPYMSAQAQRRCWRYMLASGYIQLIHLAGMIRQTALSFPMGTGQTHMCSPFQSSDRAQTQLAQAAYM